MPDIAMCFGTNCPKKETCYRFTAKPSRCQSYYTEPPMENGECERYWPVEVKKEKDDARQAEE